MQLRVVGGLDAFREPRGRPARQRQELSDRVASVVPLHQGPSGRPRAQSRRASPRQRPDGAQGAFRQAESGQRVQLGDVGGFGLGQSFSLNARAKLVGHFRQFRHVQSVQTQDVIADRRRHRLADLAGLHGEHGLVHRGEHPAPFEGAQCAAASGAAGVVARLRRQLGEVGAGLQPGPHAARHGQHAVPLARRGLRGEQEQDLRRGGTGAGHVGRKPRGQLFVRHHRVGVDHFRLQPGQHLVFQGLLHQRRHVQRSQRRVGLQVRREQRVVHPQLRHRPRHLGVGGQRAVVRDQLGRVFHRQPPARRLRQRFAPAGGQRRGCNRPQSRNFHQLSSGAKAIKARTAAVAVRSAS